MSWLIRKFENRKISKIFLGKIILPLNRGAAKSGAVKSGSDCSRYIHFDSLVLVGNKAPSIVGEGSKMGGVTLLIALLLSVTPLTLTTPILPVTLSYLLCVTRGSMMY